MKINREIKFRGKRVDRNEWVYGYLLKADYGLAICEDLSKTSLLYIDGETIGQYTGLKNKNGVEIYEGDIINDVDYGIMICKYINGSFVWQNIENELYIKLFNYIPNMEIIGNIYENKELLKEEGK